MAKTLNKELEWANIAVPRKQIYYLDMSIQAGPM